MKSRICAIKCRILLHWIIFKTNARLIKYCFSFRFFSVTQSFYWTKLIFKSSRVSFPSRWWKIERLGLSNIFLKVKAAFCWKTRSGSSMGNAEKFMAVCTEGNSINNAIFYLRVRPWTKLHSVISQWDFFIIPGGRWYCRSLLRRRS